MSDGTVKHDLLPHGEMLRQAIRWISARREEDPKIPSVKLIQEAALRFDLSPPEEQFLIANFIQSPSRSDV